jgi:hypothetical protein
MLTHKHTHLNAHIRTWTLAQTHTHIYTRSHLHTHTQMEAGKALDIVRSEADVLQLVADVHCIIAAMMGSSTEVRG